MYIIICAATTAHSGINIRGHSIFGFLLKWKLSTDRGSGRAAWFQALLPQFSSDRCLSKFLDFFLFLSLHKMIV